MIKAVLFDLDGTLLNRDASVRKALTQLNIEPSESVYVGDHPINEIKAAKNAGLIGIRKRNSDWDYTDDFTIDDLHELPQIIEKI